MFNHINELIKNELYDVKLHTRKLKKCPDCGGKMERNKTKFITDTERGLIAIENIDADICSICGAEYLTAESDKHVEMIVDKILARKILSHKETVFRIAAEA